MATRVERAREYRKMIDSVGMMLTDEQAIEHKALYRQWETLIGTTITEGEAGEVFKFLYDKDLYKYVGTLPHTFAKQWVPGVGTESLYARIDETHVGTLDDPIPYEGNMSLEQDKYYIQDDVIYYCIRNTDIPVYNHLSELVGIYVEVVN